MIRIREIQRECKCSGELCGTYKDMKRKYYQIPRGEMVLEINITPHFLCKEHAMETLLYLKKQVEETIKVAEELGWGKNDKN